MRQVGYTNSYLQVSDKHRNCHGDDVEYLRWDIMIYFSKIVILMVVMVVAEYQLTLSQDLDRFEVNCFLCKTAFKSEYPTVQT